MKFKELDLPQNIVNIGSQSILLKIASTVNSRNIGLSEIDSLPSNSGLFFWYGETRYPNAKEPKFKPSVIMSVSFNLTVLFLSKSGKILQILKDLKGGTEKDIELATEYYCKYPTDLMIELPGDIGLDINTGDIIDIQKILQNI